jgi:hypothetical protein
MWAVSPRSARVLRPRRGALALAAAALAASGCGEPAARVSLVNVTGRCGRPAGATELRVIAYARGGDVVRALDPDGETAALADLPRDTEQIGIEVVGAAGVLAAVGKTAPLDFAALPDGATVPIFMAPIDDFCAAADLREPRLAPLVARTTTGVLVVGGVGPAGQALATAERYDLATNTFVPVAVPAVLGQAGFVGAQLTAMPDGRVVLSGGRQSVIAVYDPRSDAFGEAKLIAEGRAFHGAIAVAEARVLTTAGCPEVLGGACGGAPRRDAYTYDVDEPGVDYAAAPGLIAGRIGAQLFDAGLGRDGQRAIVAAGGEPAAGAADPTAADVIALEGGAAAVPGTFAQAAALDGGGVLTAFAPDGAAPLGAAAVIALAEAGGAPRARAIAAPPARRGARLVTLEDGRVLAIGGGDLLRYDPGLDAWQALPLPASPDRPSGLSAPQLVRLADGAVLVLGGALGGAATARTWIYRPGLLGPAAGSVTVVPGDASRANVITPLDPAAVTRAGGWALTAAPADLARALVGGPRQVTGAIRAVVRVRRGGVALIAQQRSTGDALIAEVAPGAPARLARLAGTAVRALCTGAQVAAFEGSAAAILELELAGDRATLRRDGAVIAACATGAGPRGAWGVAALGGDAGAEVVVDAVTVARAAS